MIEQLNPRSYIARLRTDPRARALFDGWVAQATLEAEQQFPDPRDEHRRTLYATEAALRLAMSFVLDNDGELQAVLAERDRLREQIMKIAANTLPSLVVQAVPK